MSAHARVRASTLRGLRELVDEAGGDGAAVLREAGIPASAVDQAALVPSKHVAQALRLTETRLHQPGIAFDLVARQDASILGPLAVGLESAPTVREALACTDRYLFVHAPDSQVSTRPGPRCDGSPTMDLVLTQPVDGISTELGLGLMHRVLALVCGPGYGLLQVRMTVAPSGGTPRARRFFGAPVVSGVGANALRVPASLADQRPASGNPLVHQMAVEYLEARTPTVEPSTSDRVRQVVLSSLGTSTPLLDAVARLLVIHPRTLQRRLAEEGTSYGEIVDAARRETALRLVTTTNLPLWQVASLVGLADPAVLTRNCRRWFGTPPSTLRRQYATLNSGSTAAS